MSTRANRAVTARGVELTKFTKVGGPLTKRISLAPDGKLVSDGSACVMSHGTAERVKVTGVGELATLIGTLRPNQAIALGMLRTGLPDKVKVVTAKKLNDVARPDIIARTSANVIYQGPAFALLDFDTKGMPPAVAAEMKKLSGFWPALVSVLLALGRHRPRDTTLNQLGLVPLQHRQEGARLRRHSRLRRGAGRRRHRALLAGAP